MHHHTGTQPPKPLNYAFSSYATTIFEVMSKLAAEHQSVNLGQGFPDDEGPESMKQIASRALYEQSNQYPSLLGVPQLRQAVARHRSAAAVGLLLAHNPGYVLCCMCKVET
jgi:aspartate/methionine/tyrosine aminotransferase